LAQQTLIDITAPLTHRTAPFPGDTPFGLQWTMRMSQGMACNVSALTLSPHVGTHADAPYHYDDQGATIEAMPLDLYIGPVVVVHVQPRAGFVTAAALEAIKALPRQTGSASWWGFERVLLRTDSYLDVNHFDPGFAALEPAAVDLLADAGVRLIGIDTPSVDPASSHDLPAHARCRVHGIVILEVLRLAHVQPGPYELIAAPLAIGGGDASPVRAILRAR